MKIVFLSDIHGSRGAAEKGRSLLAQENADAVAVLGDVLYHGPRNPIPEDYDPKGVAEIMNSMKNKITAVRGNCDAEVDQLLIEYPMMSDYSIIYDGKRRIFLTHGHIFGPQNLPPLAEGDIIASGHTHIPVADKKDGIYHFNPGSITLPKGGFAPSYGLYDGTTLAVKSLDGEIIKEISL